VPRGQQSGGRNGVARRLPDTVGRMLELHRVTDEHREAVLAFELENRAYFARSGTDRGDEFYENFAERYRALLDEQDAGICVFFVLVDSDESIVGRFNLYDLENGVAEVGYRVAERVAGRGVATQGLSSLCRKAAEDHGLRTLTAGTSTANVASQRVLEKVGFASTGVRVDDGKPSLEFTLSLADVLP
jgi:[ribosomal protein S5]-alanine N-acetyltransferase